MDTVCEIDKAILIKLIEKIIGRLEDWLIIGDTYGKIIYVNERVCKTCGLAKEAILGQDMCMFVGIDLSDNEALEKIQKTTQRGESIEFVSNRFVKKQERVYLMNRVAPVTLENNEMYYTCISKDITSTKKLKEEIYRINYFDTLTKLPNEKTFEQSLCQAIKLAKKKKECFTVSLIDIKQISEINSLYGASAGEKIIQEITNRIRHIVGFNQELFKYASETFAMIHSNMGKEEVAEIFFKKLEKIMLEPIKIHNTYISVAFHSGNVTYSESITNGEMLVEMAQIALAKAKKEKLHYIFYSHTIRKEAESKLQVELEVLSAIQNDQFIVYYQPFVDLESEHIVGMEALLRIRKKNGEIMTPASFINVLEKMNLIGKVGIRVLEIVCKQIRDWLDLGYKVVPVSVNLSAMQFQNPHLAEQIKSILEKYEISPKYIVLEITESAVMEDIKAAQSTIDDLKTYGFATSIDDFGTGYASIGYLKKFMFDHLKIDISFIREIVENIQDRTIVEAIISIAKTLNLKTIAEGIENKEQFYIMSVLGCEMGQGFFWDRPISAKEIESKYFNVYQ